MMKRYYSRWIEKHSWLLLLLLVVPGLIYTDDNYKIVTCSYLLIISFISLYWLLNPAVIKNLAQFRGVQLFAPFLIYSLLSIFWSTNGYAANVPVRCLGMSALLTLCYLVIYHKPEKLPVIANTFLVGGTACLILAMYQQGLGFSPHFVEMGHAVFDHHVYIAWLAAILLLLLLNGSLRLSMAQCALFCFFLGCIILSAGRGGLLVFLCGYISMIFSQENRYREKQVFLCLILPILLIFVLNPLDLLKMTNKGASSRGEIFAIHFKKATDSKSHFLFGRGLNTSTDLVIKEKTIPHFHSLYLTLMYKGGVIGLLLYLAMLAYIIYQGLRVPKSQPWIFIVIGMSVALAVDASDFFVWPSPLMTCFIIPLFLTLFSIPPKSPNYENPAAATTG